MAYPTAIPVASLKHKSKFYKPSAIAMADDFYTGGDQFNANKHLYLDCTDYEKSGLPGGNTARANKVSAAVYEDVLAGLVDFIVAATTQSKPVILATGPAEKTKYYNDLNDDTGRGQDLNTVCQTNLLKRILHQRAYYGIGFPDNSEIVYTDLQSQKADGALDAAMLHIDAITVDDWQYDEDGQLEFVRTHNCYDRRSEQWLPPDIHVYCWSFFTKDAVYEYEISTPIVDGRPKMLEKDAVATLVNTTIHSLQSVPLVPVNLPVEIIEKLVYLAKLLFNRTVSLEHALNKSAYAMPVFYTEKDIKTVILSETSALKLNPTDKADFLKPPVEHFAALAADCERIERQFYQAIQAAALQIRSEQNTSRLSGKARLLEHGSLAVVLGALGGAERDAIETWLDLVRVMRQDDDVTITVSGLDKFDAMSINVLIDLVSKFIALPQASPTAKKFAVGSVANALTVEAPPEIRELVANENLKDNAPLPMAPIRTTPDIVATGIPVTKTE